MKNIIDNFFRWLTNVTYIKDLFIRLIVVAPLIIGALFLWFVSVPLLLWYLYVKFGNQRLHGCRCPKCNKLNDCNDKFCIFCGSSMITNFNQNQKAKQWHSTKKTCSKCNYENESDSKFCIKCGSAQFIDNTVYAEDQTIGGYIIILLAFIAKGDDVISKGEAALISTILDDISLGNANLKAIFKDIFLRAKDNTIRDHTSISKKLHKEILAEMNTMSERLQFITMIAMYFMALVYIDGSLNSKQNTIVTEILKILGFTDSMIRELHEHFKEEQDSDPNMLYEKDYEALGCKSTDSDETIKKAYREMAKKYHPDSLSGKDVPEAVLLLATEKFKEINAAYEKIKKKRGIK